ncbi:hypothetical protein VNO77_03118 [Canavalia gladiata]|uniref:Uncharacterized protein n=1 Tax=Canavalia gladiata TaxID=3824 RepID=A0AAN9MZC0_CANGL
MTELGLGLLSSFLSLSVHIEAILVITLSWCSTCTCLPILGKLRSTSPNFHGSQVAGLSRQTWVYPKLESSFKLLALDPRDEINLDVKLIFQMKKLSSPPITTASRVREKIRSRNLELKARSSSRRFPIPEIAGDPRSSYLPQSQEEEKTPKNSPLHRRIPSSFAFLGKEPLENSGSSEAAT